MDITLDKLKSYPKVRQRIREWEYDYSDDRSLLDLLEEEFAVISYYENSHKFFIFKSKRHYTMFLLKWS